MSKLLNLKEWLTVDDSIKYLSEMLKEKITLQDIYQLILDEEITLSIKFPDPRLCQLGKESENISKCTSIEGNPLTPFSNSKTTVFLEFDDFESTINGVWDLPMFGGDRITIERRLTSLLKKDYFSIPRLSDMVIKQGEAYARILCDQEFNPGSVGSMAYCEQKKDELRTTGAPKQAIELLENDLKKVRDRFVKRRQNSPLTVRYYTQSFIPSDVIEVIKVEQIINLLSKINQIPPAGTKQKKSKSKINTKEKFSYLILISALCEENNLDPSERGSAGKISRMVERYGTPITEDTVRKILKEIPEALMAREK